MTSKRTSQNAQFDRRMEDATSRKAWDEYEAVREEQRAYVKTLKPDAETTVHYIGPKNGAYGRASYNPRMNTWTVFRYKTEANRLARAGNVSVPGFKDGWIGQDVSVIAGKVPALDPTVRRDSTRSKRRIRTKMSARESAMKKRKPARDHACSCHSKPAKKKAARKPRKAPKRDISSQKACGIGTEIQTLVLSQQMFNERQAAGWVKRHGFRLTKIDVTANNYRFRQHPPSNYQPGSFRTIRLRPGVEAVIGCPA